MFIPNLIFGKIITTEQAVGLKMISHDKFSSDYVWIIILLNELLPGYAGPFVIY